MQTAMKPKAKHSKHQEGGQGLFTDPFIPFCPELQHYIFIAFVLLAQSNEIFVLFLTLHVHTYVYVVLLFASSYETGILVPTIGLDELDLTKY